MKYTPRRNGVGLTLLFSARGFTSGAWVPAPLRYMLNGALSISFLLQLFLCHRTSFGCLDAAKVCFSVISLSGSFEPRFRTLLGVPVLGVSPGCLLSE